MVRHTHIKQLKHFFNDKVSINETKYSAMKILAVVHAHWNHLNETLQMSTHNMLSKQKKKLIILDAQLISGLSICHYHYAIFLRKIKFVFPLCGSEFSPLVTTFAVC